MENKTLDKDIVKAVRTVIRVYEQEKEEAQRKKIYHNTYLLMKKYNVLKQHINDVESDIDIENEFKEINEEDIWIVSIARSKVKSMKMLSYVDSALEIVENNFEKNNSVNEFIAFRMFFIEEKNNEEIMKKLNCGKNSPKKWSDNVLKELGNLLWGYDALGI